VRRLLFGSLLALLLTAFSFPNSQESSTRGDKAYVEITVRTAVYEHVSYLARFGKDSLFTVAVNDARILYEENGVEFFEALESTYRKRNPKGAMRDVFRNANLKTILSLNAPNPEVLLVVQEETFAAVDYAAQIVESRLKRMKLKGLEVAPNQDGNISIRFRREGANMDDVRAVIETRGRVGIWETYTNRDLFKTLTLANTSINEVIFKDDLENKNALLMDFNMPVAEGQIVTSAVIGSAAPADTARILGWFSNTEVRKHFPEKTRLMWASSPNKDGLIDMFAIKGESQHVDGEDVVKSSQSFDEAGTSAIIVMEMNEQGTEDWYWVTSKNVDRQLAVEMDGQVVAAPLIKFAIANGKGFFTVRSTTLEQGTTAGKFLANVMTSEAYPVAVKIVKEEVVEE
jgi:SecD/SecF fusion protein